LTKVESASPSGSFAATTQVRDAPAMAGPPPTAVTVTLVTTGAAFAAETDAIPGGEASRPSEATALQLREAPFVTKLPGSCAEVCPSMGTPFFRQLRL
jgi:hypothetical protein